MLPAADQPCRFVSEFRMALRRLTRSPGFTLALLGSLAIGIAAEVTMLDVVDGLLFRPPSHVQDIERLVDVRIVTYPDFLDLRERSRSFVGVAASALRPYSIIDGGLTTPASALLVSDNFFQVLGARLTLGRSFLPEEGRPDGPHVAVLGYALWENRYDASHNVLGRTLRVAGDLYTIIGVAPPDFQGVGASPIDLFMPIASTKFDAGREALNSRDYSWVHVVARLAPGVSAAKAQAEAKLIFHRSNPSIGDSVLPWLGGRPADLRPIMKVRRESIGAAASVSLWLAGVATVVLLIACANAAGLSLARAVRRQSEIAIRAALGASRLRLLEEHLIESSILAAASGSLGVLVAWWAIGFTRSLLLADVSPAARFDLRLLAIAIAATLVTLVLSGLLPAIRTTSSAMAATLATRTATPGHVTARNALLVSQIAVAFVLVLGAGLFTRSLRKARGLDLGMSLDQVLIGNINVQGAGYDAARMERILPTLLQRLSQIPGIRSVAATGASVSPGWINYTFSVPGRDSLPAVRSLHGAPGFSAVTPGFFATVGTPIVLGRGFEEGDRTRAVIVVDERFARLYWPNENPLGKCVKVGDASARCTEVIGVTEARRGGPLDSALLPEAFVLLGSVAEPANLRRLFPASQVAVRVEGDLSRVAPLVQTVLQESLPDVPLAPVRPALSLFDRSMRSWRLGAAMFSVFGMIAALLAVLGVYAVVAFNVAHRKRELGIRIAVGATPASILRLIFGQSLRILVAGLTIGILLGLLGSRAISALLFEVSPMNPAVYAATAVFFLLTVLLASALPARRAARTNPIEALRQE